MDCSTYSIFLDRRKQTKILGYLLALFFLTTFSRADNASASGESQNNLGQNAGLAAPAIAYVGGLKISVRTSTEPAMPAGQYDDWLSIMKVGTGVGGEWLVLPDPRLLFSAAILVPGAAIGYTAEKGTWERVYAGLTTFDISRRIADSSAKRLSKHFVNSQTPKGQIDIKINALGLVGSSRAQLCLILESDLVLNLDGVGCFVRKISVTRGNRMHDEPPPQCADIDSFEDQDAQLVKDTLREYAEITAFLTVQFIDEVAGQ